MRESAVTAAGTGQGRGSGGRSALVFFLVVIAAVVFAMLRKQAPVPPDELDPAELVGTPLRVPGATGDRLFLLTDQHLRRWERHNRPSGRLMVDRLQHYSVHRWELWALDADSLKLQWRRVLREARPTIPSETAPRLLGSDGEHVWWQAGEAGAMPEGVPAQAAPPVGPQALSVADGAPRTVTLPEAGPAHLPAEAEHTIWRYQSGGVRLGDRWLGLLTDEEAQSFQRDSEREHRWPDRAAMAQEDYGLWQARIGEALAPSFLGVARHRFAEIRRLMPDERFRQAGWLRVPAQDAALAASSPDGAYVLHRGALAWQLDRIAGDDGRRLWRVDLPQARLIAMSPGTRSLLFAGTRDGGLVPGTSYEQLGGTVLSAVALGDGRRTDFDLAQASLGEEGRR
jgi:hypothetical protein